uniref:DNA (cytosine-5-)-methyltransferase n=1 Tax=Candidatus Kentrum sp. TC TaxID=2126339 RepID=A0A450YKS6_9GAMM|nr:MAG: DNA (cytosine-5)-methyltransferase 1 [Candidatus Kentron sp. TC]
MGSPDSENTTMMMTTPRSRRTNSDFALSNHDVTGVRASVVDVFCGVGSLSHGFKTEGFPVACGIDVDESCRYPFEKNNDSSFIREDVAAISSREVARKFHPNAARVLAGCAPCQPFSVYNQRNNDPKWQLVGAFSRLIREIQPNVVTMENVPRLVKFRDGNVFRRFVEELERTDYHVWWKVIFCPNYGVPQQRSRLVLLASRHGPIGLEPPTHFPDHYVTVRDAIGKLPPLEAGGVDNVDPMHRASGLSERNLRRIRESRPGGTWRDWSEELVTECHRRETGQGYGSVYGRMAWNRPSPTITTQFYGFGNGRFGHPQQDRAISLREGALLQSFPERYAFTRPRDEIHFKRIGRMIGNAVPFALARAIARSIRAHLEESHDQ